MVKMIPVKKHSYKKWPFWLFFRPKLEWVYGYRGRDARSNLYLLPTGEIVYFVAAVVVLFNAEEHSQRHYMGHTEDIRW